VLPAQADAVRDQEMWVLDMVHAPSAWPVTQGQGVLVAVIDSGVLGSVSDLTGSVTEGPNLSGVNTPQSNTSWGVHGTWMASLIAGHGHGDGSAGIEGVAPQSRVLSIRVVTDRGDPNFGKYERESNAEVQKALARAITVATRRGAHVISMSLGYGAASRPVRVALQNALDHGVVVVASSGNSGDTASALRTGQAPYSFPADYPGVLGVGAVTQAGTAASFSSNNLSVEVAAPGVKVPAQGRDGQYWLVSGTSPACALTAGVAALIKSRYPHLSPALVDQAITSTAQNPPPQGYDDRVGFGTVDAAAALTAAATLSRDVSTGRGVKVATHFGGGAAAVPPVPVAPRGTGRLILYAVLVLACLAIAALAAVRLTRRSPAAVPADESWENNDPWPGNAPWPGNRAWEGNGAWPGSGAPPGHGARGDNGAWQGSGAPPGNGARGGNATWGGDRDWNGNGEWPGGEQWPARRSRWQAPSGDGTAQQTPPASLVPPVPDSPIPPGAPPAPPYLPDLSLRDLPPAQTPPAEPGQPWPPPGP
jgi:subtilisin family serine protease